MKYAIAPLRICLGGGGTDLPEFCREHGGFWVSGAINQHVIVSGPPTTTVRAPFSGCGLGSSGAYWAALCALEDLSGRQLARRAAALEMAEQAVGYQDAYISAYGGVRAFRFRPGGSWPEIAHSFSPRELRRAGLYLYHIGGTHRAERVLADQNEALRRGDVNVIALLRETMQIGQDVFSALASMRYEALGALFNQHWALKRRLGGQVSNDRVEECRRIARLAGATGVKLVGAGGGGFLLCQCPDGPDRVAEALRPLGARHVPFHFVALGARKITDDGADNE